MISQLLVELKQLIDLKLSPLLGLDLLLCACIDWLLLLLLLLLQGLLLDLLGSSGLFAFASSKEIHIF